MADPVSLVTLEQAKARCRVLDTAEDDDILLMIEQASAVVIARVDNAEVTDEWVDEDTAPREAQAATLEMVLFLYERNTQVNQRPDNNGRLPARVEMVLARLIKPALA